MSGTVLVAEATTPGEARQARGISIGKLPTDLHWWAGALLSVAGLVAVGMQLGRQGLADAFRAAPPAPVFWLTFAGYYLISPACEWTVFRRLWKLPIAGIAALARKQVANELVFGYSGEAQFYLWARRHANLETSPFGAIKDMAVLSAVAGNLTTLVLMAMNWNLLASVVAGPLGRALAISAGLVAVSSLAMFLLRRRLFSLPTADLVFIVAAHGLRIAGSMLLLGVLWHLLLPGLAMNQLLVLATLRIMLSRLPLLPAKEVMFAGMVAAIFGRHADVVPGVAMLGSLVVATHVAVAVCSGASGLFRKGLPS